MSSSDLLIYYIYSTTLGPYFILPSSDYNIKVITRFISNEQYVFQNPYTDEVVVVDEGSLCVSGGGFKKNKDNDVNLRTSTLYQAKVDIQDYYNSIYTHEITRLQNRELFIDFFNEIENKNKFIAFLNVLEQFNQNLNDCQTNGIVTGPYSSYVTGELILLAVDYEMNNFLKENINFNGKSRLKYSRFVDDYSIYTDEENLIEIFIEQLDLILKKYSLKLNRQKIEKKSKGVFDRTLSSVKKYYEDIFLQILSKDDNHSRILLEIDYVIDEIFEKFPMKSANNIITNTYRMLREYDASEFFVDQTENSRDSYAIDFIKLMINKSILFPTLGKKILLLTHIVIEKLLNSGSSFQRYPELREFFEIRNEIFNKKFPGLENQYYFLRIAEILYPDSSKMIDLENNTFVRTQVIEKEVDTLAWSDVNIKIKNTLPF